MEQVSKNFIMPFENGSPIFTHEELLWAKKLMEEQNISVSVMTLEIIDDKSASVEITTTEEAMLVVLNNPRYVEIKENYIV